MKHLSQKALGEVIYQRRHLKHMSQEDLAQEVGLSANTIFKYENGTQSPGSDKLVLLAQALDCSPNDLLGWEVTA